MSRVNYFVRFVLTHLKRSFLMCLMQSFAKFVPGTIPFALSKSYVAWLSRFIRFHNQQHPEKLDANDIAKYLTHLAVNRMVASSTQRQALNAIIFYYKNILNKSFDDIGTFTLSKKPKRLPVVLSSGEIERLLNGISDPVYCLMASLLYGCGMRLMDPVRSQS